MDMVELLAECILVATQLADSAQKKRLLNLLTVLLAELCRENKEGKK